MEECAALGGGVHPTVISDSMGMACDKSCEILQGMAGWFLRTSTRPTLKTVLLLLLILRAALVYVSSH